MTRGYNCKTWLTRTAGLESGSGWWTPRLVGGEYASTSEVVRDAMRVWQRERQEHAERLNAIRARVRRFFDDPRTDLSEQDADTALEAAFAKIDEDLDRAASERIEQSRGSTPP